MESIDRIRSLSRRIEMRDEESEGKCGINKDHESKNGV